MREIKLRAIYKPQFGEGGMFEVTSIDWNGGLVEGEIPLHAVELVQYTGLLDKNGKEIYEGDVVAYSDCTSQEKHATVKYEAEYNITGFYPFVSCGRCGDTLANGAVVIGNIYENPDLLTNKNV